MISWMSSAQNGYYEISRYRFNSNGTFLWRAQPLVGVHEHAFLGSEPTCITGVIGWVHGTYTLNNNGSISMTPLGDGFQQIQDPCAAVSNFMEVYNYTEYYKGWRIFTDPTQGFKLHLFQFDGSPVAPLFQVSTTPNMLPTRVLRNVPTDTTVARRSVSSAQDALGPQWVLGVMGAMSLVMVSTSLMLL